MTPSVTPSDGSQAAIAAKSSVPVCHGEADEDFDPITGRRVRGRGRDAARTVGRIERGGINSGVEKRHLGQALARAHRRGARKERFRRKLSGADKGDCAQKRRQESGSPDSQATVQDFVFNGRGFVNKPENCNSTADKRSADSCNRRSAAVSAGPAAAAGARTRRRIYSDALDNPTCCGWCSAHSRAPENLHGWSKFPWIIVQIDTDENRLQVRCVLRLVDRLCLLAITHASRIQFLFANSRFPIELPDARHFIFEFEQADRAR